MKPLHIAVIGAGPVGLTLALLAARMLPRAQVSLFDARPAHSDLAVDGRTLAVALGSVQLLDRVRAWDATQAQAITEVWISQKAPAPALPVWRAAPSVRLRASELGVPLLGAVLGYGALVAPLERAWGDAVGAEPQRLRSRFGVAVTALKDVADGVEVDAAIVERVDLAVVAEGGVFGSTRSADLKHDYGQDAWVGEVTIDGAVPGLAVERFTRDGPIALLPLPSGPAGAQRASLVWCVRRDSDPVRELSDSQRVAVLNTMFDPEVGRVASISALKCFPLGLVAQRSLVRGRQVRIGNAAQTLHPVAGQGLNLGLRDAFALATRLRAAVEASRAAPDLDAALARVSWQRAPDRWAMIAATDFLARSFTWQAPGVATLRGSAMAVLERMPMLKTALARQMMYGSR